MAKIENFLLNFNFSFLKKTNSKLKKKKTFCYGVELLFFDSQTHYVGPAITKWVYVPVGLHRACFSALGLFLGQKSKILGSIIKKSTQM